MLFKTAAVAVVLAVSAKAIQVTAPTNSSGWTSSGPQVISWDSVSTDPSNFTIQLISPDSPNDPTTVTTEVLTSDGTYTYTPSSDLSAAENYRVNFISSTNQAGILAQSDYFEVKSGSSSVSSSASASASGSTSTSTSGSASATSSVSAVSKTSGSASATSSGSSASSGAASASASGAASQLVAPAGLLTLVLAAAAILA